MTATARRRNSVDLSSGSYRESLVEQSDWIATSCSRSHFNWMQLELKYSIDNKIRIHPWWLILLNSLSIINPMGVIYCILVALVIGVGILKFQIKQLDLTNDFFHNHASKKYEMIFLK